MLTKEDLDKITKEYYPDVFYFCLHYTNNREAAEDLTQDVFVTLIKKKESLENINMRSWLTGTAYFLFLKLIEKNKKENSRKISIDENLDFVEALTLNHERRFITDITQQQIDIIFSKLNKKELMLYEMYYTKNMSYSEISKKLGVSENTLYARMKRLKDKVKKIINEEILFF